MLYVCVCVRGSAGYRPPIFLFPPRDGAVVQNKGDFQSSFALIAACAAYSSEVQLKINGGPCATSFFCRNENLENGVKIVTASTESVNESSAAKFTCSTGDMMEASYTVQLVGGRELYTHDIQIM